MQLDRKAIKARAREALKENYWMAVGMLVVVALISGACSFIPAVGSICALIVVPVIAIGFANVMVRMFRGEACSFEDLFNSFKNFGHNLGGYWWEYLWTFLWSLLFIIPGIVKSYAYFMTKYILMDHPDIDPQEALKVSMEITNGHKWEIFVMQLSFLGWGILSVFTCGILQIFYVGPYMELTAAGYYAVLSEEFFERMGFYDSLSGVAPEYTPEAAAEEVVDNSTVFADDAADQAAAVETAVEEAADNTFEAVDTLVDDTVSTDVPDIFDTASDTDSDEEV